MLKNGLYFWHIYICKHRKIMRKRCIIMTVPVIVSLIGWWPVITIKFHLVMRRIKYICYCNSMFNSGNNRWNESLHCF